MSEQSESWALTTLDFNSRRWRHKKSGSFESLSDRMFKRQLVLVKEFNLPLFLHLRDAQEDFMSILEESRDLWSHVRGVVHSFTGTATDALRILKQFPQLDIGINGCSLKTETSMLAAIPIERLHLETDCPWCSIKPTSHYFKYVKTHFPQVNKPEKWVPTKAVKGRNEPQNIVQVAEVVHAVHSADMSFSDFAGIVFKNSERLFCGATYDPQS